MNTFVKIFGLLLFFLLSACGTTKTEAELTDQSSKLEAMVADRSFEFQAMWAMPLATNSMNALANSGLFLPGDNIGRINLIGNPNYLRFKTDSVSASLPYYGERQLSGAYNSNQTGIQFEGVPKNLKIDFNENKKLYTITFTINKDTEGFRVNMQLFTNLQTTVSITSSNRTNIRYQGEIKDISEKR